MIEKYLSNLLDSRTQAHIFHLQTDSFAKHKALQAYYEGIIPLIDSIAESYQGKDGIIKGYTPAASWLEGDQNIDRYFQALLILSSKVREKFASDPDLQNQIDEVSTLIKSTQYLLKQLS